MSCANLVKGGGERDAKEGEGEEREGEKREERRGRGEEQRERESLNNFLISQSINGRGGMQMLQRLC